MIDLLRECRHYVFIESRLGNDKCRDLLKRLDAALAGKDAVPLTSPSVAPADTLARIRE